MTAPSYRSVLKSTSVIGGAAFINMLIGMVRTKFVAVLLGPYGVGLMGVYMTIVGMVSTISSMGTDTSGVRQIAEAHGVNDETQISRMVATLLRTVWVTGLIGAGIMILGSSWLSRIALGTADHAGSIAWLGLAVLLTNVSIGWTCLLQGTRRIGVMAKAGMMGSLISLLFSVPFFYRWGVQGIVPGLILAAMAMLATTWWFSHRVPIRSVVVPWRESKTLALQLLHFGLPVMCSGIVAACSAYFIRALLVRQVGLDGVGLWQAAFNLSGVLVNFILGAMVADYYPRLVAVADDPDRVCEEVNAQTEIALFLAVPGLAATLVFAPLAVTIFYSGKFDASIEILRWFVFGLFGRIIAWPMGLVLLAKGMGKTYFTMEALGNIVYIVAIWFCTHMWGLPGAGLAFLLFHVFNTIMVRIVVRGVSRTVWSRSNALHVLCFGAVLTLMGLISWFIVDPVWHYAINVPLLGVVGLYCLSYLSKKSGITVQSLWSRMVNGLDRRAPPGA